MKMLSLRGGGNICSDTHAIINNQEIAIYKKIDPQMIELFIQDLSQKCQSILTASQKIGMSQSKDEIIQEIKWFQLSSQFLNQIVQDKQMVQENIQLILSNLEILLEAILNIIQSQFFLSYHLLQNLIKKSKIQKQLQDLRFQHNINYLFLSKDNKYLLLSDLKGLYAYDIYSQSRLFFLKLDRNYINNIKFNQESTEIITADWTGKLWDLKLLLTEKQNQNEEFYKIYEAQTSPDNLLIYYYFSKQYDEIGFELFVANTKTGEQLERINISFIKFLVCLSGRFIYFIDIKHNLIKYDINSKKFDNLFNISNLGQWEIKNIGQSHDYRLLNINYFAQQEDDRYNFHIFLLNEDATKIESLKNIKTNDLQFSHDRMSLYYIGQNGKNIQKSQIRYKETEKKFLQLDEPNLLHDFKLEWFFITQDDEFIIVRDENKKLYKWNISKLEKVQILDTNISYFRIFNQYLMVWQDNSEYLCLYDLNSLQLIAKQFMYNDVYFNENNKMMISNEDGKFVKIWKFNKKIEHQAFNLSLMIPKNRNDEVVLHNLKWDNSKIQSHLNFDLITLWTQKTQNIK